MLTLTLVLQAIDTILPLSRQLLLEYARNKRDIDVMMLTLTLFLQAMHTIRPLSRQLLLGYVCNRREIDDLLLRDSQANAR